MQFQDLKYAGMAPRSKQNEAVRFILNFCASDKKKIAYASLEKQKVFNLVACFVGG